MSRFSVFLMLGLLSGAAFADEATVTRILYLQNIHSDAAVTLLRSEAQVQQIAQLLDLEVLVVRGTRDRVDRSESLLRERNAVAKATDPHAPELPGSTDESSTETRVFGIQGVDCESAIALLRALYQIRELSQLPAGASISVTAPAAKLERSEALLKSLGVLAAR